MRSSRLTVLGFSLILVACGNTTSTTETSDDSLVIRGSDTEVQMVSNLAEAFAADHPEVNVSVTGGGSATGIASLLNGDIRIANSSRPMSEEELTQAQEKGIDVREFIVARDGLSVILHPSNPVQTLTLEQVGELYRGEVTNWKDLGGPDAPVVLYGRQSTSGTYGYFRDAALKGDYAKEMRSMEGTQAILDAVLQDEHGIGYVGVGYLKNENGEPRTDVKIIPLAQGDGGEAVSPLDERAVNEGRYPLSRPIYQYLAGLPAPESALADFLLFEASGSGQLIVKASGFYPVTTDDAAKNDAILTALSE